MNNFTIRTATIEDSHLVYEFILGIAKYEKMLDQVVATHDDIIQSIFINNQAEVIIGDEDGVPVSFALFFHNYSTFKGNRGLYLEDLFVNPDKRGKGYGKILLLHLAKLAHERGCSRMEWCCLDWNKPSIEFYKKLGAISMDEWTTYRFDSQTLERISGVNYE